MKKISGITLIETLLALVIGALILVLALKQYDNLQRDNRIQEILTNVDTLFYAMGRYYRANCSPPYPFLDDPCNGTPPALVVCPASVNTIPNPVTINITTDLINKNYLSQKDLTLQPLIDQADSNGVLSSINGYTLQFNIHQVSGKIPTRDFCQNSVCQPVGMVILWDMQLALKLTIAASSAANTYAMLLGAQCVSDYADRCGTAPPPVNPPPGPPVATAKYLIFTRVPSHLETVSSYWVSNAAVKQFKQQYETLPDWIAITNPSGQTYYYCGA